jgi:hypothetical protein
MIERMVPIGISFRAKPRPSEIAMISVELRRLGTDQFLAHGNLRDVDVIGICFTLEIELDGFAKICCRFFTGFPKTRNIDAQTLSDEIGTFLVQTIFYRAHT